MCATCVIFFLPSRTGQQQQQPPPCTRRAVITYLYIRSATHNLYYCGSNDLLANRPLLLFLRKLIFFSNNYIYKKNLNRRVRDTEFFFHSRSSVRPSVCSRSCVPVHEYEKKKNISFSFSLSRKNRNNINRVQGQERAVVAVSASKIPIETTVSVTHRECAPRGPTEPPVRGVFFHYKPVYENRSKLRT